MARIFLFISAVAVIYIGGFIYEQTGPLLYAVVVAIVLSSPLLLKISFWKKLLLIFPLLVLRVVGKILLTLFGKNALSRLMRKYGLLERRFNKTVGNLNSLKQQVLTRWGATSRESQAYLILVFLPVALVLLIVLLLIKMVRFKFLQFIVEKIMQRYLVRMSEKAPLVHKFTGQYERDRKEKDVEKAGSEGDGIRSVNQTHEDK